MKILKKGKDMTVSKHTETFTCPVCGCEFEASEDEYWIEESSWIASASTICANTYSYTTEEKMHCNCPQCHAKCFVSKPASMPTITLSEASK